MNFTLRQARRLEQAVEAATKTDIASVSKTSLFGSVPNLVELEAEFTNSVNETLKLIALRFRIRQAIAVANEKAGLSSLMATESRVKAQMDFLKKFSRAVPTKGQDELRNEFQIKHNRLSAEDNHSYGYSGEHITFNILSQETIQEIEDRILTLKKEQQSLADEMLKVNMTQAVVLADSDVELLKSLKLL